MSRCDCCGGALHILGVLGTLVWARCEDCGMDQTVDIEPSEGADHVL